LNSSELKDSFLKITKLAIFLKLVKSSTNQFKNIHNYGATLQSLHLLHFIGQQLPGSRAVVPERGCTAAAGHMLHLAPLMIGWHARRFSAQKERSLTVGTTL
jgi:hypothetical protein